MRARGALVALVVLAVVTALPPWRARIAHAQGPSASRPTDVTAVMSGSPRRYDGSYRTSQVSRLCGELSPEESGGERVFVVEFPDEPNGEITSVSFRSTALVGGGTTTDRFHVTLGLRAKNGGRPPSYVVNRTIPSKTTGTARLTAKGGTAQLTVQSVNELGEAMDLTVVCRPRA